ncbi:MAG: amino acid adenylation domain-containing protein [Ruminococcus sp.]|nr:amino acid adenylation domain-containing protein [Ruminococcus sp.]
MEKKFYNLSGSQKNILMAEQYFAGKPVNNVCQLIHCGVVDVPLMIKVINDFIEHTQAIRFVLTDVNALTDEAQQYIKPYLYEEIPVYDLEKDSDEYKRILNEIYSTKLEPTKKMYRFAIIRFPNNAVEIAICTHHLVTDGYSYCELTKLLMRNYLLAVDGEPMSVRMNDYTDFIETEQKAFSGKTFERNVKFWNEYLEKEFTPAKFTIKDAGNNIVSDRYVFYLSQKEKDVIHTLMKSTSQSLVPVMMALYGVYFSKNTDSERLAIGSPYFNRMSSKERNTFGVFVNMLPMLMDLKKDKSFAEVCENIGKTSLMLLRHQRFPYTEIQRIADKFHGTGDKLYNVMFNYIPMDLEGFDSDWVANGTSEYELCIHITECKKGELKISYDYLPDITDIKDIEMLHQTIFEMAEWLCNSPSALICEIPMVYDYGRKLYSKLNDTKTEFDDALTIFKVFEKQRHNNDIAVICEDESITYAQLHEKTDIIATALQNKGITTNDVIAICMKRSISFICAVFGVIKAGAVFLPMDINWPDIRKKHVIEDSDAKLIIDDNIYAEMENKEHNISLYTMPKTSSEDICYMIYTSGSTGKPKGVMISHKNAVNFSLPLKYNYLVKEICYNCKTILSIGNLAFDISISEYFPALLNGKRLVLCSDEELNSIEKMTNAIVSNNVDCLQCTPSRLLEYLDNSDFSSAMRQMKVIMLAAEVFPDALASRLNDITDNTIILNGYGPTETTMGTSYAYVSNRRITIGKPISNVSMYIMNSRGTLLAPMQIGELCIGGNGVGIGYKGNIELTAEKFVDTKDYGRIYRTGDLARLNTEGEIEFFGRIDRQIKFHGLRIEISEIENVMLMYSGISGVAVTVKGEGMNAFLVGYYCASEEIDEDKFTEYLSEILTYYMVPSVLCRVNDIPKTSNGKIDYASLPDAQSNEIIIPCENELQKKIFSLVCNLLGTENFGITTNLFRVGMTSLLALKFNTMLNNSFSVDIGVSSIMKNPTISAIEKLIDAKSDNLCDKVLEDVSEKKVFPIMGSQLSILLECEGEQDNFDYHIPMKAVFSSETEPERLCKAVATAVKMHSYLLSVIKKDGSEKVLVKTDNINIYIPAIKCDTPENVDFVYPFEIEEGELFRAVVYYNSNKTVLYIDVHHIICDGQSLEVLLKDIERAYNGITIPAESCDGFTCSLMERAMLNSEQYRKAETFYDKLYKGAESVSKLYSETNESSGISGNLYYQMNKKIAEDTIRFATKYGVTAGNILLATVELVISRYTMTNDVIIAVAENGRSKAKYNTSVGMLVKTLMLRNMIDVNSSVISFVRSTADNLYSNMENDIVPYAHLTSNYGIRPEIMFTFQNYGISDFKIIEETAEIIPISVKSKPKFPISFDVSGNNIRIEYDSGLYNEKQIETLLSSVIYVYTTMLSNPDMIISDISTISSDDEMTIERFNCTEDEFSSEDSIVSVFERTVSATAQSVAVIASDGILTYDALNRQANRIANALIKKGVKKGNIVTVILPRTTKIIASMLGIMKVGAVYLILSTDNTKERISFIENDADAVFQINENNIYELLNEENELSVGINVNGNDMCYVIYTSGSTGIPKGVMINHISVLNYSLPLKFNYHVTDVLAVCNTGLSIGNYAFDISVAEIYPMLLSGRTVVIADDEQIYDVQKLAELIKDNNVEFMVCTPTRLMQYLENAQFKSAMAHIKVAMLAGEACTHTVLNRFRQVSSAILFNGYGPTETTAGCTFKKIISDDITIGSSISNVKAYVMDQCRKQLPIFVPGELCISGKGVARGYIKRDELTAKSFVYSSDGTRMYCTGDIVYRTENGEFKYLGRMDNQVKLRGYRIELSEIEKVILTYTGVNGCAVIVNGSGNMASLYAYITTDVTIDEDELKKYMMQRVTEYMIPSCFVYMDKLPVNANGKTDIKALRLMDIKEEVIPCKTKMQKELCNIISELFECENLGLNTDFYRIGLTSLTAMRVAVRLEQEYGITISSKQIMKNCNIERLAEFINSIIQTKDIVRITEDRELYPLTKSQIGIFAEYDKNRNSVSYNMPMLISFDRNIDVDRLANALEITVQSHSYLKSYFVRQGTDVFLYRNKTTVSNITLHDDVELKEDEYINLIRPFALEKSPLYRIEIYKCSDKVLLFMDFHHIIFDGTSYNIFLEDVIDAFNGKKIKPEVCNAFEYAILQSENVNFAVDREYFVNMFGSIEDGSRIFADNKEQENFKASYYVYPISKDIKKFVSNISTLLSITPADVYLSCFMFTLSKYCMNNRVAIGTVENGRDTARYQRTLGMLVRTFPLCIEVLNDETVSDFARRVHNIMIESSEHSSYTYTDFVSDFSVKLDTHFVYNEETIKCFELEGMPAKEIPLLLKDSKFAFSLSVSGDMVQVDYRNDIYNEQTVSRFVKTMLYCVEKFSTELNSKISSISLATYSDIEAYRTLNNTDVPNEDTTMDRMFANAVTQYSDKVAVVCGDSDCLTYKELGEVADKISAGLKKLGIGRGNIVAFGLKRGIGIVKAIFGIIRAGAAILPTDITWPEDRVNYVLENSGAKLFINEEVLCELEKSNPDEVPILDVKPDDLSYVIYTSGSTGKPKGAMLIQRNLTNFLKPLEHNCLVREMYSKCNSILSISNVTFDISICEIFPAIFYGRKLAFADDRAFDIPYVLAEFAKKHNVDCIQGTPSRIGQYMEDSAFVECLKNVKVMLVAGESLNHSLTNRISEVSDTVILNGYGPTETTLAASYQYVTERKITIGKPVANAKMYIVDKWLNLQPQGCVGELCIGGWNVGTGYIGRENLTREKFVRNPFHSGMLYHSGDFARLTDDGEIDFLGRMDNQIKLHGLRIELDEIESVMLTHPQVNMCAVKVSGKGKNAYLCGYYTADGELSSDDLKNYLRQQLTYYMVPGILVRLDAMPISTAGKIDRQHLPEVEMNEEIIPCETKLQKKLCDLVCSVLGDNEIGINTDLFRLGLTSLLAVKLGTCIYKEMNVELSSVDILKNNTVLLLEQLIKSRSNTEELELNFEKLSEYSLTDNQMGVYLDCVKFPEQMKYNIPCVYRFDSNVSPDKLKTACESVISAHIYLKSRIKDNGASPMIIRNDDEKPLVKVSYSDYPDRINFIRPFNISDSSPLYRIEIYYNDEMTCLYMDFHHLIFDGESMSIFIEDIKTSYEGGLLLNEKYTFYEYSQLKNSCPQNDIKYYCDMFSGVETASSLHQDKNENGLPLGRIKHTIDEKMYKKLESFAINTGVTLSSVYLAGFRLVISSVTGKDDVTLAMVWDGRNDRRFIRSIGMFVKTIPMRIKSNANELSSQYVNRIQQLVYMNADHDKFSYASFCSKTGILPEILYVYQNHSENNTRLGNFKAEVVYNNEADKLSAKFPVTLNVVGNELILEYDSGKYESTTMTIIMSAFVTVLDRMTESTDIDITRISLASDSELEKLEQFNRRETSFPIGETIVSIFEKQARKTPDAVAVIALDKILTYNELNRNANRIAHSLINQGIGTEDIVAVKLPRTSDIITVFLGIMKAGAVYLPLDINYPESRINYCMTDSRAKLLIDETNCAELFKNSNESNPMVMLTERNLCYVIYTSGSTGKPKGVLAEHRGVLNYSLPLKYNYHAVTIANECSVSLAIGSLAFDIAVAEIYPFLLSGKTVILCDENSSNDVVELATLIKKYHADALLCTPSRLLKYIEYKPFAEELKNFKSISAVGEAVPIEWLNKMKKLTSAKLYNGYGPTETTAGSVFLEMNDDYVNIGKPLSNEKIHIVDHHKNILPVGIAGELCISGYGVSRGYLNRDELTAEKFIQTDYSHGRMYCTGDFAKWNERGEIEYIGRIDNQIKYHGYRIEIGEIEQAISSCNNIGSVAVVLRELNGVQYMFAYFTANENIDTEVLKKDLQAMLPHYMIPSAFMQLAEMPLDLNAKIDKKALPNIDFDANKKYVAPSNPKEEAICKVFAKILGLEKVSADASFFELGGDSIKGIQVASEITEYGYRMQMRQLFESPSAREMAQHLTAIFETDDDACGEIPLSAIQHYFFTLDIKNQNHWNQSVMLTASQRINIDALRDAMLKLTEHHDELRADFTVTENTIVQFIPQIKNNAFIISECDEIEETTSIATALTSLKLNGHKIYALIIRGEKCDKLFITIHHLVVDTVSWRILLADLEKLYNAYIKGQNVTLGIKTTSYKKYAQLQQKYAESDSVSAQREYWEKVTSGMFDVIPTDKSFDGVRRDSMLDKVSISFNEKDTAKIKKAIASDNGFMTDDIMISALMLAVKIKFGINSTSFMQESHGRENFDSSIDVSRTVGWFTSFYPVGITADKDELSTLCKVKEQIRAIPENGYSYVPLRYLTDSAIEFAPEIQFNYLGEFTDDSSSNMFTVCENNAVVNTDDSSPCMAKLSFSGSVVHSCMTIEIEYNKYEFEKDTIKELMNITAQKLIDISEILLNVDEKIIMPSDFGIQGMNMADWKKISNVVGDISQIEAIYPATDMQTGMLLLAEHYRERSYYHEQIMLAVGHSILDNDLRANLQKVVDKHPVLRSIFVSEGMKNVYQVVKKGVKPELEILDATRYGKEWNTDSALPKILENYLTGYMKMDRYRGFDTQNEVMFRTTLFNVGENKSVIMFSFSHVILDKWSMDIVLKEIFEGISAEPDNFSGYAKWLKTRNISIAKEFWKDYMSGCPDSVFPITGKNTQIPDYSTKKLSLGIENVKNIRDFCNENTITASTFMQYAWGCTLMEILGTEDVSFGYTYSGRSEEISNVNSMVGMFIRTLPIRITANDTPKTAQQKSLDIEKYGYISSSDIQKSAKLRHPAFRYFMTFQNTPAIQNESDIYELFNHNRSRNDFNVFIKMDNSIDIIFDFDKDKFSDEWIDYLADAFIRQIKQLPL